MNELDAFLTNLRQLGVALWVEGDTLKVRADESVLTPEIAALVKQRKPEILALLQPKPIYAIPPLPAQDDYEVSAAQRRLWVLAQLPEGSAAYNIPWYQFLDGPLDRTAFDLAFERLIERHQSLRTTFISVDGLPRQVVHDGISFSVEFHDVSGENSPVETARRLGLNEARRRFDLESGPLFRIALLRLAEREHVVLFTIHHLIADGVSLGILSRDLSRLYTSALTGKADELPPLDFGYPAFAAWHNKLLGSDTMQAHQRYWHRTMSGELPLLNFPTDFPRPPVQRFRGRELAFGIDLERMQALQALARQHNGTLFMIMHAILKVLLFAYTGQQDIIVGCVVAGRERSDLADQVGLYLNTLALRSRLLAETSFEKFCEEVAQQTKDAFDHQIYPFDQLVGELNLARDLSRFPLFDVMLIEQNQDEPGLNFGGLKARPVFEHTGTSKFDLTFCFKAHPGTGILLGIEYSTDLFSDERIAAMGEHFSQLVNSVLADSSLSIGHLNVLPDRERKTLLRDFNQTSRPYPNDQTIVDLLEAAVLERPEAIALICGPQQTTFRELHAQANRLARHLQANGIAAGKTLAICLKRSSELVIALLAVLKSGATYVPLDPRHPTDRLAHIIKDAGISAVIMDGYFPPSCQCPTVQVLDLRSEKDRIAQQPETPPARRIAAEDLAYVIYTSGTTGRPKGVEISHGALTNFLLAMRESPGLAKRDVFLAVSTVSFDIAALEMYLPLLCNARLVLAEDDDVADGWRLNALMKTCGATAMQATPSTWQMLLASGWQGHPELKILCGGEALSGQLAAQLLLRAKSVWNMYGPTETTVWSTLHELERGAPHDANVSIGRPIANTQIYIFDAQLRPLPIGIPGDLYIGGTGLAVGYRNLPELTAEKFVPNPFGRNDGCRLYKTGDLARFRRNGDIELLGRSDEQVKLRGHRIELGEIEAILATHPNIRQAVVDAKGASAADRVLLAWYVSVDGLEISDGDLRTHLTQMLPDYMIPARFIRLASLPTTANGKVNRRALSEPQRERRRIGAGEAPRTPWEQRLVKLWRDVLAVSKIGIHDNFFELDGHSLKATTLVARLQKETGVRLELVDVFRYPTVAALAARAAAADKQRLTPASISLVPSKASATEMHPSFSEESGRDISPATPEELESLARL